MTKKSQPKTPAIQNLPDVERVPLSTLRPYWKNPRLNEAAVPGVKQSILDYGLNQPLVVDAKGVIIVGHTRYRALLELGVEEVPVVRPKLTAAKAKEYRIADNKTGEVAKWDQGLLIPELRGLDQGRMQVFFPDRDLGQMLADKSGGDIRPVTAETMDKALDRSQRGMADLTRPRTGAQIRIECPGCGEAFFLDRDTILNHPGERE